MRCNSQRRREIGQLIGTFLLVPLVAGCHTAADGWNLQGVRLYEHGQFPAALQYFQRAAGTDPYSADAYYNMASTLHRMGMQSDDQDALVRAEQLYNQCLDLQPNHVACHRGLSVLLVETGRPDRAFALLKNWARTSPQVADAHIELARLHEEFDDQETAAVHLNEALNVDRNADRAWAALGRIREDSGDLQQALTNYGRAYRLNRFQTGVAQRIAALEHHSGGWQPGGGTRVVTRATPSRY